MNKRPDLNLMVVFDAVASTGSVTGAASLLKLSQPAISHALNRLRAVTGDPLFVRSRGRLLPTPHAERLAAQVSTLLEDARSILARPGFDTGEARVFRLGCSDYSTLTSAPALVAALREQSARSGIEFIPVGAGTLNDLETGAMDATYWGATPPGPPFEKMHLHQDHFVCVTAKRHPLAQKSRHGRAGLQDYLDHPHARVAIGGAPTSIVDQAISRLGHSRQVAVTAFGFSAILPLIDGTDLIATVPARLAVEAELRGLTLSPLPFELEPIDYFLVWHRRKSSDPAHIWFRDLVAAAAKT